MTTKSALGVRLGPGREREVELALGEVLLELGVADRRPAGPEQLDPVVVDVDADDPVVLPQQDRHGEADIAQSGDNDVGHGRRV